MFVSWGLSTITFLLAQLVHTNTLVSATGVLIWAQYYFIFKLFPLDWVVILSSCLSSFGAGLLVRETPHPAGWFVGGLYFGVLIPNMWDISEYLCIPAAFIYFVLIGQHKGCEVCVNVGQELVCAVLMYPLTQTNEVGWLSCALGITFSFFVSHIKGVDVIAILVASVIVSVLWIVREDTEVAGYYSAWGLLVGIWSLKRGVGVCGGIVLATGWLVPVTWVVSLGCSLTLLLGLFFTQMGNSQTLAERCHEHSTSIKTQIRRRERACRALENEKARLFQLAEDSQGDVRMVHLVRIELITGHQASIARTILSLQHLQHQFETLAFSAEDVLSKEHEVYLLRDVETVLRCADTEDTEVSVRLETIGISRPEDVEVRVLESRLNSLRIKPHSQTQLYTFQNE